MPQGQIDMKVLPLSLSQVFGTLVLVWLGSALSRVVYNLFLHPLRKYPGPLGAKATTWWKTYIEVVKQESMPDVLLRLHSKYGWYTLLDPPTFHANRRNR
jgi:hypothetical protein